MAYFVSTAILAATLVTFFAVAAGGFTERFTGLQWALRIAAAAPIVVSGLLHFLRTAAMAGIVPPFFPDPLLLVRISGILELAGAAGLFFPRTRRMASLSLALLMIAVFPANIYAANQVIGGLTMPGVPVRLAMQVFYILLLLLAGWGIPSRILPGAVNASPGTGA